MITVAEATEKKWPGNDMWLQEQRNFKATHILADDSPRKEILRASQPD